MCNTHTHLESIHMFHTRYCANLVYKVEKNTPHLHVNIDLILVSHTCNYFHIMLWWS